MRAPLAALILALFLQTGTAGAAAESDRCAAREQALRAEAEKACSGLSYLFNPSGCFIARKALTAFDVAACRATAAPEQTSTDPPQPAPAAVPSLTTPVAVPPLRSELPEQAPLVAAEPEPDMARLKAENARLKAEIERLRAELEQLKAARGAAGEPH
jgi:hypothetical protein